MILLNERCDIERIPSDKLFPSFVCGSVDVCVYRIVIKLPNGICLLRRAELSEGFFLLQPRLVAGVSVTHVHTPTSGKLAKRPNGFHRGRLAARRKS